MPNEPETKVVSTPTAKPDSVLNSSGSAPPPTTAAPRALAIFDVVSKFCTSFAALVLSGVIGFATIYYSRQATERQANAQIEALALQRRSSAAQIETSLLPVFMSGKDAERRLALDVLASLAPAEAERIGAIVIPRLQSDGERREATQFISSVPDRKRQEEFRRHIQNGAVYRQFSLDPNACREYFAAFESLSVVEKERLAAGVETARKEYDRGQFTDAAARLQAVLSK